MLTQCCIAIPTCIPQVPRLMDFTHLMIKKTCCPGPTKPHRAPPNLLCFLLIIKARHPVAPHIQMPSGSPSPLQLNEFTNVFDFDFSTALPSEFPPSSPEDRLPEALPTSLSRRRSPPCTASRSPRNLSPADFVTPESSQLSTSHTTSHDPKRRYPCLILGCARRFTSQYTLKVHMEAHRPKPRVSFPCTLGCSEKFSRQHDRLRHEVAKHGKICEFSCSACGRFFSSSKTLGNHKCPVSQGQTRWVNV
ncbi:hypothetical protein BDZ94DRAFT_130337 [Collybia nuda]|uniref:C2H2-type domain-containing protein n=1 Tax=Collybia nuda TaxID=64659 RepID=A0A9P5YB46_9AGAR|nr:hypothetical protein BDZ94DRAFT_130337 [Collybia nuda]